ncbi:MAG: hypothetical protein KIS68_11945 [Bauldia sp.]|nr:hypothetical protein [Bauldia sp.]MCW5777812.1 hypothetical protein [Phycisphaeraceae bacterium]
MMYRITLAAFAATFLILGYGSASAQNRQCTVGGDAMRESVASYYDPRIDQVQGLIDEITAAGGDANGVRINVGNDEWLTPVEIVAKLRADRALGVASADTAVNECNSDLRPYQDLMDAAVAVATGGLSEIAPGKMLYVDISDILAGYPLGGPNALIPAARTQIFEFLGMGPNNDLRRIIEDPLRAVRCIFGC